MRNLRTIGLSGRLLGILVLVVALDFLLNAIVFERANEFSVKNEEAERIADHLEIARRLIYRVPRGDRPAVAEALCTDRFKIGWTSKAAGITNSIELDSLRQQILEIEPSLRSSALRLHIEPLSDGGHVSGSMLLPDASVVTFHTDVTGALTFNAHRALTLLGPTILLIILGMVLLKATLNPLKRLVEASRHVGSDDARHIAASGTYEVKELIVAFNAMQDRIHQLIRNRQIAVSAIAHDLRTPLSRLQMRLEHVLGDNAAETGPMAADLAEMKMLLESLQAFNQGLDHMGPTDVVDIAIMLQTQVDTATDRGYEAEYSGPDTMEISAKPLALRRIFTNLIENALHYAGNVIVYVFDRDSEIEIRIEDDGPGIREEDLHEVLQPFVRLDEARPRDTPGMGLGLAIVDQMVKSQGGTFDLSNRDGGGLRATITLPRSRGRE